MEKRIILAIFLMLIVAVLPSILFPPKKPADGRSGGPAGGDTTAKRAAAVPAAESLSALPPLRPAAVSAETVWVTSPTYRLGFSTRGAALVSAELLAYHSFTPGDSGGGPVQLVPEGRAWLRYALTAGGDTAALADWTFSPGATRVHVGEGRDSALLSFTAERGGARIELEYRFYAAEYRFAVRGRFAGFGPGGATLLVGMGDGLRSVEADSMDDFRHYAVVTKAAKTFSTDFQSLKPGERRILDGPFEWAGVKSKYFFLAGLAFEENQPRFGAAIVAGGPRTVTASSLFGRSAVATRAPVTLTLPVPPAGDFRYQVYVGPLEYRRLAQLGHDLDDRSEEHTSELQSHSFISYAVFCLQKKKLCAAFRAVGFSHGDPLRLSRVTAP